MSERRTLEVPRRGNVCIVLLTGIGDVVMGLPLLNALRAHAPESRITWVAEPGPAEVLRHHPAVDEIIVYRKNRGVAGLRELWSEMAHRRFDLTINLMIYFKAVWPTLFSRAPHRLGFERGRARDLAWLASNHHLRPHPRGHTVDMFLEFAETLGVPVHSIQFGLTLTPEEVREQARWKSRAGDRPLAVIAPASGHPRRDWFADRFAGVVDALEHDFGYRTLLVGGFGERELRHASQIMESAAVKPIWGLEVPIRTLLAQISAADLLIAPDTGPVHIARAFEVPVIGVYGHTNPYRTGPYRLFHDLWVDRYTDPGETPDSSRWDAKHGRMEQITAEDVLERVELARTLYGAGRRDADRS